MFSSVSGFSFFLIGLLLCLPISSEEPCPDFSGTWKVKVMVESNDYRGLHGETLIPLPAARGTLLPEAPAKIAIEQRGCLELRFRVLADSASHPAYHFAGRESVFSLKEHGKQSVDWSPESLTVRYRLRPAGPRIFPGLARTWSQWRLKRTGTDRLEYEYSMTEKGATLFVFPFKDASTFKGELTRTP